MRQPRYYEKVERGEPKQLEFDVAVYGGTPAGVTAAIQSARMGKRAVLLSFNRHVGGMTSGGLTATDVGNYRWPDGTYTPGSVSELPPPRRGLPVPLARLYEILEAIFQDHVNYQQGLMYFLANDPRVPKALRQRVNAFGLDPREFAATGHWPHHLYVREGRRMVSDYIMTQGNCESKRVAEDPVGLASYPMDSHFCQRVVVEEGGVTTMRPGRFVAGIDRREMIVISRLPADLR